MLIQAVIFDRDGVLTDFKIAEAAEFFAPLLPLSMFELGEHWAAFGDAVGFPSTLAEERVFFTNFWDYLNDAYQLAPEERQQLHTVDYTQFLTAFADARPALETARNNGKRVGVLSNFSLASLDTSLAVVKLADLVDAACAATVIGVAKPQAEAYLTVARELNVAPDECLFFDDELPCVEGARVVGMQAYWVDRQRTSHALTDGIVADLTAVADLL